MAIETERKYLILMPSCDVFASAEKSEIEQIYISLKGDYDGSRIRKRKYSHGTVYYLTSKKRISDMSAVEDESIITEIEYEKMKSLIEKGSRPLQKTRYVLPYRGFDFEIDVYPFWGDRAVMEVELPGEDAEFELPPEIEVVKEITSDARYKNHALSYNIPDDVI